MIINYCVYNSTNNAIIHDCLDSYEQAIEIADRNKSWVASNTKAGLRIDICGYTDVTHSDFFNLDNI